MSITFHVIELLVMSLPSLWTSALLLPQALKVVRSLRFEPSCLVFRFGCRGFQSS